LALVRMTSSRSNERRNNEFIQGGTAMKYPKAHRAEGTTPRSGRLSVDPYYVEDVGLTPADLARDRSVIVVINHQ
jgi:hypothetical protein